MTERHVIGAALVLSDGRVKYQVRAEDPISGIVGHGGGEDDLPTFLGSGWHLDGRLEKPGDEALILSDPPTPP